MRRSYQLSWKSINQFLRIHENTQEVAIKVKVLAVHAMKAYRGAEVQLHYFSTPILAKGKG